MPSGWILSPPDGARYIELIRRALSVIDGSIMLLKCCFDCFPRVVWCRPICCMNLCIIIIISFIIEKFM